MKTTDRRILILYAKFGDGHYQAAQALKRGFEETGLARAVLFDPFGEAYPTLNRWCQAVYYFSTSHLPAAYGFGYSLTDRIPSSSPVGEWLHSLGSAKLAGMLNRLQPDAVVQTFPLLAMSHLRRRTGLRLPTFTVLTDYVPHSRWIHEETDRYFVATEELGRQLADAGAREEAIRVSGIPIRRAFIGGALRDRIKEREAAERAGKFVLVMAGAYGVSGEAGMLTRELLKREDCSVLLVCGKNAKLEQQMRARFARESKVRVFGFVERIDRLMAKASCMITKAGGITLSEAASIGLPVVVYRPIPGQEHGNALYWERQGKLTIARDPDELLEQTARWLAASGEDAPGRASGRGLPSATEVIADEILAYLERSAAPSLELIPRPGRRNWLKALLHPNGI
ncbi:processive diacylglycerol beta-glucosyltransferase [Cohnella xylanilytica]|uniref:MGDG synthase family glycosyltransferase n=1 Tax=Cohnella xylanilytica TaxID=557555 RepID=UPI001AFFAC67|nr:glycosyltransferase [Cohnella xylanilytica]GIO13791.1 processive diacylglycerol beta-glucosyltransferase [Cohnella xylanilytica]